MNESERKKIRAVKYEIDSERLMDETDFMQLTIELRQYLKEHTYWMSWLTYKVSNTSRKTFREINYAEKERMEKRIKKIRETFKQIFK